MLRDLRLAVRMLLKTPGFTAVALLTLALGIGANTAIFTLVNAVLLQPLPVSRPQQLVLLTNPAAEGLSEGTTGGDARDRLAYPEYLRLRAHDQAFTGLAAFGTIHPRALVNWSRPGHTAAPEMARTQLTSNNYFSVLGVAAYRGRFFNHAQALTPGGDPVAVMRYGYWNQRFHRDASVIGRTFTLHGTAFTVIGITPPGFFGAEVGLEPDLWMPIAMQAQAMPGRDLLHNPPGVSRFMWLQVIGRLKPGVGMAAAQAQSNAIFKLSVQQQLGSVTTPQMRSVIASQRLTLTPGGRGASAVRGQFSAPLLALFALVGLVLLLAVVNLASLLLARAAARQKEMGVRLALGAGRGRVLRQLLTESVLLALIGGGLGALLAWWGVHLLLGMVSAGSNLALPLAPDARVLGFVLGISVLAGILFGLAPAWLMARTDLNATLQAQGRAVHTKMRLTKGLVTGQVAISVILLVGAGLFLHSLLKLEAQKVGFNPKGLVETGLDVQGAGYHGPEATGFYRQLLQRGANTPGVKGIAFSMIGLFNGDNASLPIHINGYTPPAGGVMGTGYGALVMFDQVSPGYFQTVGIPILMGRALTAADDTSAQRNAVISETAAKTFFKGRNPIGHHIRDTYPDDHGAVYTIVGVCADIQSASLGAPAMPQMYLPFLNGAPVVTPPPQSAILIRESGAAAPVAAALRRQILAIAPNIRVQDFQPLSTLIDQTTVSQSLLAKLSGFFGALALLLAAIGLYGVMAYSVSRRTAEIGVRMALGASGASVVGMVMREMLLLLAMGLAIGIPISLGLAKMSAHDMDLFQLHYDDPVVFVSAAVALAIVAVLAGWLPALRASRVDPLLALRQE
ncbi:MAG: ABC transporter permease [Terriglobales bacterium]